MLMNTNLITFTFDVMKTLTLIFVIHHQGNKIITNLNILTSCVNINTKTIISYYKIKLGQTSKILFICIIIMM